MELKKLTEVCSPKQWKTISQTEMLPEGYPVYGANGIIGYYNEYNHENPTVLITCRGATCGTLNISKPFSYVNGNAMALDNVIEDVDEKYYYYLQSRGLKDIISGSAQPQITIQSLTKVIVSYPSIEEQKRIVSMLDKADEIRAKKKLANDKLDEFLKSTFISMFGDPKTNSKCLPLVKIKDLCTVQTGSTPKRDVESYYKDATIPWVKTGEVINQYIYGAEERISEKAIKETNCKLFPKDTILVAMYGQGLTRGRVGMLKIEASTNQACAAILPSEKINQEYLYNQLKIQYQTLRDYGRGGNQPNLNMDIVKNFEITISPIEDQNKFAKIVEKVEAQKQKNELVIEQMNNLFNSLSQRAFKGEL